MNIVLDSLTIRSRLIIQAVDAAVCWRVWPNVLEGGVKGWVKSGPQFARLMDGYKEPYWQDLFAQEEAKKSAAQGRVVPDHI